ncbi:MAG: cupin domain-containing protein [Candidatus Thorarchaeota archaeon]
MTLTQVHPGGKFSSHRDEYDHVFYFIDGNGKGWIGEETYDIRPHRIVEVPAGELHGYENTSEKTMLLITVNSHMCLPTCCRVQSRRTANQWVPNQGESLGFG